MNNNEKEVEVDKSLLDDGSYLEEEPKNNKILFIVLGVVVATLSIAGAVVMFSGGSEEVAVVEQPTTPSLTLTENSAQTEELVPIELTIETEPEMEVIQDFDTSLLMSAEDEAQMLLESEINQLVSQMNIESETQAEQREELMVQAGYDIDEETQVITAPNGNTITSDGTVTSIEGVVLTDNSVETNADGSHTVVYKGTTYTVTQDQIDRAKTSAGYKKTDGIPASVFIQIDNAGYTDPLAGMTSEEFRDLLENPTVENHGAVVWS